MVESYSGFGGNGEHTGLKEKLEERGVSKVFICGLANDFCVGITALDSAKRGFKTYIIEDAARFVAQKNKEKMNKRLFDNNVNLVKSYNLLANYNPEKNKPQLNILNVNLDDEKQWKRLKSPRTLQAMKNLKITIDELNPVKQEEQIEEDSALQVTKFSLVSGEEKAEIEKKRKLIIKERAEIIKNKG